MSWAYSACALLFQQRAGSAVTFDFSFSLRLLRCLRGSLREHDCAISTINPRSFTLKTSISTTPQIYFAVRNISVFSNFHNATIVIQRIQNLRYDVRIHIHIHTYIHTYIHTDTARVQHVNVGLAQARPNNLIVATR